MSERFVVGIDLGTTHSVLAWADAEGGAPRVLEIPQLVSRGVVEPRGLLPSFVFLPHESEGKQPLPWDAERTFAVGEYARSRGAESPDRVIASAKSWLGSRAIDRRSGVLPIGAPPDVERISPVEASWRYLEHLAEAWEAAGKGSLAELEVILTVPASFDAIARDLTVEAALAAGLERVHLLEEPQAALYAWIASRGEKWREEIEPGDVILVVDVGGGTTDFSAILAEEANGSLELERLAVGDHILLGGDNMDLALAHLAAAKLEKEGHELDAAQRGSLVHAARGAKERLLSEGAPASLRVGLAGKGSKLVGSALSVEITEDEVRALALDGFFPVVPSAARPAVRSRAGLKELGLPYASDPAVTKHLASFLAKHAGEPPMLMPSKVLWNGGVFHAAGVRARLLEVLGKWAAELEADAPRELVSNDFDGSVARGAAFYGLARRGKGLRIRSGTARAYYVGIESSAPAVPGVEPPISALCVAPLGMEEGTEAELPPLELAVVVGEPVRFRFFSSNVRFDPAGGMLQRWREDELEELEPLEVCLPAEGREDGDLVPVRLASSVTSVGTLLLEAVPVEPVKEGERFKIELGVREPSETTGS